MLHPLTIGLVSTDNKGNKSGRVQLDCSTAALCLLRYRLICGGSSRFVTRASKTYSEQRNWDELPMLAESR